MIFSAARPPSKHDQLVIEFLLADAETVFVGNVLGDAQGASTRNDRDLVDDVGTIQMPGGQGMPRFVVSRLFLLAFLQDFFAFGPHQDFVASVVKVAHVDDLLVLAGRPQRRLVDHVANVGTGQDQPFRPQAVCRSTSSASGTSRTCTLKIASRPFIVGRPTVMWRSKRPGRSKAGIEHIGAVGRGNDDHRLVAGKAIHLAENLVQASVRARRDPHPDRHHVGGRRHQFRR